MIVTSDTWGRSIPSRMRFTPTRQSIVLFWRDLMASFKKRKWEQVVVVGRVGE